MTDELHRIGALRRWHRRRLAIAVLLADRGEVRRRRRMLRRLRDIERLARARHDR